ncbi:hypothetical protein CEUSTIGMA_g8001.t1 [Chlamydomonas eustigma]|uniref:Peroxisomal membrane protein MPV17 n=1 Tax=Chlamydomonas eustigma TaxID=1157962 RepID=A0A250XBW3_9CHLO|nr:hypothetical protein CEUSTIGMA_g8001.t1 [Chlamydomonas eustigma]|eukprot:GAX80564.1 hypothetical protein CEUSTIGMA_g8001.t1 [Chlamydomonas eustigma]
MNFSLSTRARRLWIAYERQLERRPVPIQMTTSFLLWGLGDLVAQKVAEQRPAIDTRRALLTAAYGMGFMGPVGHYWYLGLDGWCAHAFRPGTPIFLAAKIAADQVILGPIYVLAFYLWGALMIDNTGFEGFKKKMKKDFISTYTAELCIWPPFQAFNFTRIPVEHHLLAVNCMTLLDVSFLSWARCQEDWVATLLVALHLQRPAKA